MSRLQKTKKLFFDRYLYKVSAISPIADTFRGKNLDSTEEKLSSMLLALKSTKEFSLSLNRFNIRPRRYATKDDLNIALDVCKFVKTLADYHFRVEGQILNFYTNSETDIDHFVRLFPQDLIRYVVKPESDSIKNVLLSTPKTIISQGYTHKYKVTINPLGKSAEDFKTWSDKLPKIKRVGDSYKYGGYFYVADLKTLSLCQLFLADKIRRVDELVTPEEI